MPQTLEINNLNVTKMDDFEISPATIMVKNIIDNNAQIVDISPSA
jgi:hypothetical protein